MNATVSFTQSMMSIQETVDYYYRESIGIVFDDYRYLFITSLLVILVSIEIGRKLQQCHTFREFIQQTWYLLLFVLFYIGYGLYSVYRYASVLQGVIQ